MNQLNKLKTIFGVNIEHDDKTNRHFVRLRTPNGVLTVIQNEMTEQGTYLIATEDKKYIKVSGDTLTRNLIDLNNELAKNQAEPDR